MFFKQSKAKQAFSSLIRFSTAGFLSICPNGNQVSYEQRRSSDNKPLLVWREQITNLENCIDKLTHFFEARRQELLQSSDETILDLKNELVQAKRIAKVGMTNENKGKNVMHVLTVG